MAHKKDKEVQPTAATVSLSILASSAETVLL